MPLSACLCQAENMVSKQVFFSRIVLIFADLRAWFDELTMTPMSQGTV
jgi:hypothetical protein